MTPSERMRLLRSRIPGTIKSPLRRILRKPHPQGLCESELRRLSRLPSGVATKTQFFGRSWEIPDVPSFLSAHKDIFVRELYQFTPTSPHPRIIDAGANIGVASLFFAFRYPGARIQAFEPDPDLFRTLSKNLSQHPECASITLKQSAIWKDSGTLSFRSDGADGGCLAGDGEFSVPTVTLSSILREAPVDFLKLDIEGAEVEVLVESAENLDLVHSLVVEYHGRSGAPPRLGILLRVLEEAGFHYSLAGNEHEGPRPLEGLRNNGPFELMTVVAAARK